jgi:hypothetical protein
MSLSGGEIFPTGPIRTDQNFLTPDSNLTAPR